MKKIFFLLAGIGFITAISASKLILKTETNKNTITGSKDKYKPCVDACNASITSCKKVIDICTKEMDMKMDACKKSCEECIEACNGAIKSMNGNSVDVKVKCEEC
ncbi:MAG TPA: hypothetical protein VN026_05695, partial [Bacteroidia bacterium]|nr:hypothetical protein [Bacteroidia bacterium]